MSTTIKAGTWDVDVPTQITEVKRPTLTQAGWITIRVWLGDEEYDCTSLFDYYDFKEIVSEDTWSKYVPDQPEASRKTRRVTMTADSWFNERDLNMATHCVDILQVCLGEPGSTDSFFVSHTPELLFLRNG